MQPQNCSKISFYFVQTLKYIFFDSTLCVLCLPVLLFLVLDKYLSTIFYTAFISEHIKQRLS